MTCSRLRALLATAARGRVAGGARHRQHELNAVVLGPEFGRQVQAMFERDLAESNEITLDNWQQRGLDLRVKELFAQGWEYCL